MSAGTDVFAVWLVGDYGSADFNDLESTTVLSSDSFDLLAIYK